MLDCLSLPHYLKYRICCTPHSREHVHLLVFSPLPFSTLFVLFFDRHFLQFQLIFELFHCWFPSSVSSVLSFCCLDGGSPGLITYIIFCLLQPPLRPSAHPLWDLSQLYLPKLLSFLLSCFKIWSPFSFLNVSFHNSSSFFSIKKMSYCNIISFWGFLGYVSTEISSLCIFFYLYTVSSVWVSLSILNLFSGHLVIFSCLFLFRVVETKGLF